MCTTAIGLRLAVLLTTVFLAAGLLASAQAPRPPHGDYGECRSCHGCIDCHSARGGAPDITAADRHHPLGVAYAAVRRTSRLRLRPENLPSGFGTTIEGDLLTDGRITCTTCHDSHDSGRDFRFRLRAESQRQLCCACHELR